jgi:hypothetical protein
VTALRKSRLALRIADVGLSRQALPTTEGRRRYPQTNGFYRCFPRDRWRYPCRCKPGCAAECNGSCGCPGCSMASLDRRVGSNLAQSFKEGTRRRAARA